MPRSETHALMCQPCTCGGNRTVKADTKLRPETEKCWDAQCASRTDIRASRDASTARVISTTAEGLIAALPELARASLVARDKCNTTR